MNEIADQEGAVDLIRLHQEEITALGLFNEVFYIERYPDVAQSGMEPFAHFLSHGIQERRQPSELFSPFEYVELNSDLAALQEPAIVHFVRVGRYEGRFGSRMAHDLVHSGLFDPVFYISSNPDVEAEGVDPLVHYVQNGWRECRSPSAEFDLPAFWNTFTDVVPGTVEPVLYYISALYAQA